jgi:hypothetical protein
MEEATFYTVQILSVNGRTSQTEVMECQRKGCTCKFPVNRGIVWTFYLENGDYWKAPIMCSHTCVMALISPPPHKFQLH